MVQAKAKFGDEIKFARRVLSFQEGAGGHPPACGEIWILAGPSETKVLLIDSFLGFVRVAPISTEISFAGPRDIVLDPKVALWSPAVVELFAAFWTTTAHLSEPYYRVSPELLNAIRLRDRGIGCAMPPQARRGKCDPDSSVESLKDKWRGARMQIIDLHKVEIPLELAAQADKRSW